MSQTSRTRLLTAGVLIAVFGTGILVGLVMDSELGATPPTEVAETPDAGRVYIYRWSGTVLEQIGELVTDPARAGARLGASIGVVGDVNGDGYGDLVVGAMGKSGRAMQFLGVTALAFASDPEAERSLGLGGSESPLQ